MIFGREKIKNYYMYDTHIENEWIGEYMAGAPGEYVKVFLFAAMYAELRVSLTQEDLARELAMDLEDVLKAWNYWEEKGAIKKHFTGSDKFNYKVEILNLKEQLYGKNRKVPARSAVREAAERLDEAELRALYRQIEQIIGRPFASKELLAVASWLTEYEIAPDVVLYAYRYCAEQRGGNTKGSYVGTVLHEWISDGLKTVAQIEEHVQETNQRYCQYKRIFKALGFTRMPGEAERKIMDSWFDEMGYGLDQILEACGKSSGISNPNINYVNGVLKNWKEGKKGSGSASRPSSGGAAYAIQQAQASYEADRREEAAAAERRKEEVLREIPRIREIEELLRTKSLELSKNMLGGARQKLDAIRLEMEQLQAEKVSLLTDHNFRADYLEIRYKCEICKDTGLLDTGERCECFQRKLKEFEKKFEKETQN